MLFHHGQPGANVLAEVTPSAGLPVAQQGTWNVGVTGAVGVTQSGSWSVTVVDSVALTVSAQQSGSWTVNVGTVGSITGDVTVIGTGTFAVQASISGALPAGTNLIGQASVADQVATLFNGTTSVTPQYAAITTSSSARRPSSPRSVARRFMS